MAGRLPASALPSPAGGSARLLEVFATPRSLLDGAAEAGDPLAVLPVLYHLLWLHRLAADLSVRLEDTLLVWLGEEPRP